MNAANYLHGIAYSCVISTSLYRWRTEWQRLLSSYVDCFRCHIVCLHCIVCLQHRVVRLRKVTIYTSSFVTKFTRSLAHFFLAYKMSIAATSVGLFALKIRSAHLTGNNIHNCGLQYNTTNHIKVHLHISMFDGIVLAFIWKKVLPICLKFGQVVFAKGSRWVIKADLFRIHNGLMIWSLFEKVIGLVTGQLIRGPQIDVD